MFSRSRLLQRVLEGIYMRERGKLICIGIPATMSSKEGRQYYISASDQIDCKGRFSYDLAHMTFLQSALTIVQPFPTYRRFLTPLQQMTFESILTKSEIAHNEHFLLLSQCFFNYF